MARYLVANGHQGEGIFAINTRDVLKHLRVPAEGDISVNMGKVQDESEEVTASIPESLLQIACVCEVVIDR